MAFQGEDVYATLLLSDSFLLGALVLAHSLRDAGTTKKLAVLVTTDTVSADATTELQKLFNYIVPVERVVNSVPANLFLMQRADLQSTFTKITLWKQLQFRRVVYVDADMVALRAPDELFDLPHPFSAAPDIGWPDIFNTGLMILTPNMGDYYALLAMAQRGISFDGADQGLLNMHFKNTFNRLSFSYNVTPSAHYQYLPAYRHFQSSISMAHFIGPEKPWAQGREANRGSTPYDELVGRWWAVYDRHFRASSFGNTTSGLSSIVQSHVKGESPPVVTGFSGIQSYQPIQSPSEGSHIVVEQPFHETTEIPRTIEEAYVRSVETVAQYDQKGQDIKHDTWDASRAPPPQDSRPEASNFPATRYVMSSDPTPFKAPARYPDPPKDMYYEVPKTLIYQKPAPIFPWEKHAPPPTRVFPEDKVEVEQSPPPESTKESRDTIAEEEVDLDKDVPITSTSPSIQVTPADPWQSYSRGNAWDDIPEIDRYIGRLQKNRKGDIQMLQGYGSGIEQVSSPGAARHAMKLTDFPTELERPSLPVTPAPIRKPVFWGAERDEEGELPAAEGVPSQAEWDPIAKLESLAKYQTEVLAKKLGEESPTPEIPLRPLPYGSEGAISPTYVAPKRIKEQTTQAPSPIIPRTMCEPSFHGSGALWDKGDAVLLHQTPLKASEEEKDVLET